MRAADQMMDWFRGDNFIYFEIHVDKICDDDDDDDGILNAHVLLCYMFGGIRTHINRRIDLKWCDACGTRSAMRRDKWARQCVLR